MQHQPPTTSHEPLPASAEHERFLNGLARFQAAVESDCAWGREIQRADHDEGPGSNAALFARRMARQEEAAVDTYRRDLIGMYDAGHN